MQFVVTRNYDEDDDDEEDDDYSRFRFPFSYLFFNSLYVSVEPCTKLVQISVGTSRRNILKATLSTNAIETMPEDANRKKNPCIYPLLVINLRVNPRLYTLNCRLNMSPQKTKTKERIFRVLFTRSFMHES